MHLKYHYPNRFKTILLNSENRAGYYAYRAIKADAEGDFLSRLNSFLSEIESQRLIIKPLSKRRNDIKGRIRDLSKQLKKVDDQEFDRIHAEIDGHKFELKETEKEMLRLGRKILIDLEKSFKNVQAIDDIYSVFPRETRGSVEAALRVNTLAPSNIFYWIVELAMRIESMIKQYGVLKAKRKFRSPAGDRPERYLGNEGVMDHFLDVFAVFNNLEKSFFIRYPKNIDGVAKYLKSKEGDFDRILSQYEILDEDYPELVGAFPKGLRTAFDKIGKTYPFLKDIDLKQADKLIKVWMDASEKTLKDAADFAEVFIRVKSLYPFTIGMRSVGGTDSRGRNLEYMKYVESLNTLLDDALSRKSLSSEKLELLSKAFRFYSKNPKFRVAMSLHR